MGSPAIELKSPFASKKELFEHFADPALFKTLFFFQARDIADWLSEECSANQQCCADAIAVINKPFSN